MKCAVCGNPAPEHCRWRMHKLSDEGRTVYDGKTCGVRLCELHMRRLGKLGLCPWHMRRAEDLGLAGGNP